MKSPMMKGYGAKGEMNSQKKEKYNMMQGSKMSYKSKDSMSYPGKGKGAHDMSPKLKVADEQAIWQNMR